MGGKTRGKKKCLLQKSMVKKKVGSDCLWGREASVMPGSAWGWEWQFPLFALCGGDQVRSVYFSAR